MSSARCHFRRLQRFWTRSRQSPRHTVETRCVVGGLAVAALSSLCSVILVAPPVGAQEDTPPESVGDPILPWLDNQFYKIHLDINARIELADQDTFENSEAYTLRTRAGLEIKPYYGFSAFAEVENMWSPADDEYNDGTGKDDDNEDKTLIADPENTELNRAWIQYGNQALFDTSVSGKLKGGIQRIVWDDARFIGNVVWRQNEQTYHAGLAETNLGVEGLTGQYAYVWEVQRIWGDPGNERAKALNRQDWDSDSSFARIHYEGLENHTFTGFIYALDFENDSPADSSTTYGGRAYGDFELTDDLGLGYTASYAFQHDSANNQEDYEAHYVWAQVDLVQSELGSIGVVYELLGSDDGEAQFRTPLATAHKFNGYADAFLDNGGPEGLQDLFVRVSPRLPWKLKAHLDYHEFWDADGGSWLGREFDGQITRAFNKHLTGLFKWGWFDGDNNGPDDRWRIWWELNFKY